MARERTDGVFGSTAFRSHEPSRRQRKGMQMLNFEENGSIFCEWCLPQTSVHSEETLQRAQWPGGAGWPPMDGVMTEGYG